MNLHPFWSNFPDFESRLKNTEEYFNEIISETPEMIRADIDALFNSPGKMLRPAFVVISSSAGTKASDNLYKVAVSVELLHIASLIHDDVIDFSPQRRGRPSLHARIGIKQAVLAGDFLLARALELSSAAHNDGLVEAVNTGVSRMCLSEIEQDSGSGDMFIDMDTYFKRINGKTAELFALSCKVGAVLGDADPQTVESFYEIGKNFGMAFQIYDDVMDYRGKSSEMGKPPGNDLKAGIPTLPLILALESGDESLARLCRSKMRPVHRNAIAKKVVNGGFDKKAAEIADSYIMKCISQIQAADFKDRDLMISIIRKLVKTYESA